MSTHDAESARKNATEPYASRTFEEFWPHYVRLHTKRETQLAHAAATLSWVVLGGAALVTGRWWLVAFAPLADYAIAQSSHRLFEKNRTVPAKNFAWHTRAEFRMLRLVLTGRMSGEVARCGP
jgi:hypothetical protein